MPLFLMRLFHIDAGQAGLMFLPLTVPTLFSPLFGKQRALRERRASVLTKHIS